MNSLRRSLLTAAGLALLVTSAYVLSGPGRIDIIDGQVRFEVAQSLVENGRPVIEDPALVYIEGRDGEHYTGYGPAASLAGVPLVWLGALIGDPYGETQRFLFSFTSAFFGGALAGLLFLFLRRLGAGLQAAAGWTMVHAFATLVWPLGTSTFDQAQHATWLLLALYLAHRGGTRGSPWTAAAAGAAAAPLFLYQEAFVVVVPLLGLPLAGDDWRALLRPRGRALRRYLVFLLAAATGLAAFAFFNFVRFDAVLESGKAASASYHPPPLGNPLIGLPGLLVSPGKSIFLFSPPIVLGLLGIRRLWRRAPTLGLAVTAATAAWLALISTLSFYGGDWAWGPRYLVVVLPLWALAYPFAVEGRRWRRIAAAVLIVLGVGVQVLALAVDHQRFFFERRLPAFFWAMDPSYYFDESQLLARPAELADVLQPGVPETVHSYAPSPYRRSVTYCIFGSLGVWRDPLWLDRFAIFHLPRPWPLWMPFVERHMEVHVPWRATRDAFLLLALAGAVLAYSGLRRARERPPPA